MPGANASPQTVLGHINKLGDLDPDFRFMALNDLLLVLTNAKADFLHHDYNVSARTSDSIIKALDDQNGEVQNLAIKWSVHYSPRLSVTTDSHQSRTARWQSAHALDCPDDRQARVTEA